MPENMKSLNGYRFDAEKLNGKPGSEYASAESLRQLKDDLGKNNLLDNSNFKKTVNQRGVSGTISTTGYFIDRWKLVRGSVTIGEGGLTLNGEIEQILEKAPNNNVTAAASAGTAAFNAETNTFRLTASGELIEWAALYEGEYTAENMPKYVPRGYTAELLECQRYFFPLNKDGIGFGNINSSGTVFYAPIMLPVTMRTLPSVQTANNNYTLTNNGSQVNVSAVLTTNSKTGNVVQIMLNVDGKGFTKSIVSKIWGGSGNTYVYLNADL